MSLSQQQVAQMRANESSSSRYDIAQIYPPYNP
jgi:hypothetical protein